MPDDGTAVMDAPDVTATLDAPAASAIDTGADTGAGEASGNAEVIDNADSPQAGETGHLRGAELYRAVKEKLRNGEKLSAQEQRSIRNAIHIAAKADEVSGGDLTRFEAERQAYAQLALPGEESLAPEDLVETVRGDREQLQGILDDITSGAPRLIEELIADHPESFKSLVPQAMDRLAQLDNERFSNYVARSAVNYLQSAGLPVEFAVLDEFLPSVPDFPGKARLIQAIQRVYGAFNGLETIAAKQLPAPTPKNAGADAGDGSKTDDLTQREMNITRYEWNRTAGQPNVQLRDSEISRIAGSRKLTLTDAEKAEIKGAVKDEFEARLAANRRYGDAMQGYLRNGNQRAYNERAASEGKKLLPSIVARHTNAVLDKRTAPKPTATAGSAKPQPAVTQTKDASGNLTQWLSGPPRSVGKQVDYMRTTNAMLQRNEAYLKGEKGLFKWKAKVS